MVIMNTITMEMKEIIHLFGVQHFDDDGYG